jgi:hypothetical protein
MPVARHPGAGRALLIDRLLGGWRRFMRGSARSLGALARSGSTKPSARDVMTTGARQNERREPGARPSPAGRRAYDVGASSDFRSSIARFTASHRLSHNALQRRSRARSSRRWITSIASSTPTCTAACITCRTWRRRSSRTRDQGASSAGSAVRCLHAQRHRGHQSRGGRSCRFRRGDEIVLSIMGTLNVGRGTSGAQRRCP